jgi:hypothetical protein
VSATSGQQQDGHQCGHLRPLGTNLSENTTSFKIFSGYQFTQAIGAEVGYAQFGNASVSGGGATVSAKPTAFYAAVTGTLPLTSEIAAFGKLGVARDRTKLNATFGKVTESETEHETSALIGVGVSYAINANGHRRIRELRQSDQGRRRQPEGRPVLGRRARQVLIAASKRKPGLRSPVFFRLFALSASVVCPWRPPRGSRP